MTEAQTVGPRFWVVCAHPPHLDPRVGWSADFARSQGFDVNVFGLKHGQDTTRVDARETLVSAPERRTGWINGLRRLHRLGLRPSARDAGLLALIGVPSAMVLGPIFLLILIIRMFTRAVFRIARMGVRVVDTGLCYLPKGDALANLLSHAGRVVRNRGIQPIVGAISPLSSQSLARRVLRLFTRGRLGELSIALDGYRWYLMDHALPLVEYLVAEAETSPPEFIHAHDPDGLIAAVAVKHMCGARVVFDAHEYGPDAYLLRPKPRSLFRMIERAIVPHADAAFGVSTPLINLWQARFSKVPFALLPNASPLSDLNFRPMTPPDQIRSREGRLRVLFQGGFAPERGVDRVISEWALVEGADLYLRGPDGDRRGRLMDHARKTGLLNKSVFFLPSLSEDALIAGAAFADIGLIPYASDVENHAIACPNKLGQFMMAGLMILSTRLQFVEQIVAEAECGVTYDDLQKGALAYVVNRLANDRDFVDRSARKATQYARDEFHYEAFASVVIEVYRTGG